MYLTLWILDLTDKNSALMLILIYGYNSINFMIKGNFIAWWKVRRRVVVIVRKTLRAHQLAICFLMMCFIFFPDFQSNPKQRRWEKRSNAYRVEFVRNQEKARTLTRCIPTSWTDVSFSLRLKPCDTDSTDMWYGSGWTFFIGSMFFLAWFILKAGILWYLECDSLCHDKRILLIWMICRRGLSAL